MKPVQQRQLWRPDDHPDGPQRGDCLRCCIASIFEVPYEEVEDIDAFGQTDMAWVKRNYPGLELTHRVVAFGPQRFEDERFDEYLNWPTEHYEPGYWIAGVWSPRIPDKKSYGCGCTERVPGGDPHCEWCHGKPDERDLGIVWGTHAVVMYGSQLAWDPHPEPFSADDTLYFCGVRTIGLGDPSKLVRAR